MKTGPQQTSATSILYCDGRPGSGFSHEYCLNYHVLSDILTINMLSLCVGRHRELPPRCRFCYLKRRKGFTQCCSKLWASSDSRASTTRSTIEKYFGIAQTRSGCPIKSRIATCKSRISGSWEIPVNPQMSTIVSDNSNDEDNLTAKQCEPSVEIESAESGDFSESETQWDTDCKSKKVRVRGDEKRGDEDDGVNEPKEADHAPSQSSTSERQMPSTEILCILRHAHPDVALEMPPLPMQNENFQRYLVQCNHESLLNVFQDRLTNGRIVDDNSDQVVTHNGTELCRIVTVENVPCSNLRSKLFYAASAA